MPRALISGFETIAFAAFANLGQPQACDRPLRQDLRRQP